MKLTDGVPLLLAALGIAGCAPSTAGGVRELGTDRRYTFEAEQNYQQVYRKVLANARKCYQTGLITAQMVVQGDLYHDTKTGEITVALHGGFGVDTYEVIDIAAIGDSRTKIVGYRSIGPVTVSEQLSRDWVLDDSVECSPKKRS